MRIALTVPSLSSLDLNAAGNVQGDEIIARAWCKEIAGRGHDCVLFQAGAGRGTVDVAIHFSVFSTPWPGTKNVLYMQNAFPPEAWPGGTIGQFRLVADRYDAFLFTSARLRDNCNITDRPTAVAPFAVDLEDYRPVPALVNNCQRVVFVGNNIRGRVINQRYLEPAIGYGLVIYGNADGWDDPLRHCCRGKITTAAEAAVYSAADICLNCHINEHIVHDTVNFRVYCILACGGFIISDRTATLERDFKDAVIFTDGDSDLAAKLDHFLTNQAATRQFRAAGQELVRSAHTIKHRIDVVLPFLMGLL